MPKPLLPFKNPKRDIHKNKNSKRNPTNNPLNKRHNIRRMEPILLLPKHIPKPIRIQKPPNNLRSLHPLPIFPKQTNRQFHNKHKFALQKNEPRNLQQLGRVEKKRGF